ALDSLYACGPVFALAQRLKWSVVATFQEGRTPALGQKDQALRQLCPENVLTRTGDDCRVQEFRWVSQLAYEDSAGRTGKLNPLEGRERDARGQRRSCPTQRLAGLFLIPVPGDSAWPPVLLPSTMGAEQHAGVTY